MKPRTPYEPSLARVPAHDHLRPRILTAVPICDGHDSAIMTVNLELARQGVEVLYLGYHRSVGDVVRGAIQEDVRAIGLSSYNGGHVEFFSEVCSRLRRLGAGDIGLFGGGGGTITQSDARLMKRRGVDEIFFAGTPLNEITSFVRRKYGQPRTAVLRRNVRGDLTGLSLSRLLTSVERGVHPSQFTLRTSARTGKFHGRRSSRREEALISRSRYSRTSSEVPVSGGASAGTAGHPVARPERPRRGRAAGRPGRYGLCPRRSGVHAQPGNARPRPGHRFGYGRVLAGFEAGGL